MIFKRLFQYWKKFAHTLGVANTYLLLFLTYFLLIGPVAILTRLFGRDLLNKRYRERGSFWDDKEPVEDSLERCKYQF